ncbi:MAG: ABC transporter substrate-binding protein, partial [Dehalococcoidia bacterium]|nr:ABC transporter substrate-binding protein [Dehalococcoidia bacterium]
RGLKFLFFSVLAVSILGLLACAGPAAPQKSATKQKVVAAFPAYQMVDMAYFLARDKGYFAEEGLDVEFTGAPSPEAISAMIAGEMHFEGSGATLVTANIQGAPIKRLFTSYSAIPFWIYAKKDIKTAADLKGKSIGVAALGVEATYLEAKEAVRVKGGLDPDKDIKWVATGWEGLAGLKGGSIDAFLAWIPNNFLARDAGFNELVFFPDVIKADLGYGFGTSDKLIKENPELISKFMRGILKGYMAVWADKQAAVNAYVREAKIDPKYADEAYVLDKKLYDANKLSHDGSVDDATLKASIDFGKKMLGVTTDIPITKVFDQSFVKKAYKELQDSGWKPKVGN